jgi:hypothetical protein
MRRRLPFLLVLHGGLNTLVPEAAYREITASLGWVALRTAGRLQLYTTRR